MSTVTDLLTITVARALRQHKAGAVYRDGKYHCRCGWVSPIKSTNAQSVADHHRARQVAEAVEREWR